MTATCATRKTLLAGGFALSLALGAHAAEIPGIDDPAVQMCIDKTAGSRAVTQHITLRSFDDSGLIEESIADIYLQRSSESKSRAVIRLSGPPSRKGLAVLMLESDKLDPTMYLYVPDLRRTRRVTGKQLAASMMGTDFSYEEFSHFQRSAAESETRLRRTETFVAPIQVPFGACSSNAEYHGLLGGCWQQSTQPAVPLRWRLAAVETAKVRVASVAAGLSCRPSSLGPSCCTSSRYCTARAVSASRRPTSCLSRG